MPAMRRLARDEKGNFLVFFGISVAMLMGMVALAVDLGRAAATQTDLQSFADSVALAAAAELDGEGTAITRAIAAAETMITDRQTWGEGGADLTSADVTLSFLTALPADDAATDAEGSVICAGAACAGTSVANQRAALFVRADVTPHVVRMNFASALSALRGGGRADARLGATATAGNTQYACDISPLMFCLPLDANNRAVDLREGQMIRLRMGGGTVGQWGAGNFGFLDISQAAVDGHGTCRNENGAANITRCLLGAVERITQCYSIRGVDTETGQRVGITTDPFNYRFDLYPNGGPGNPGGDANFAPAPNTIRGQDPTVRGNGKGGGSTNWCEPTAAALDASGRPTSMALPHGAEFDADPTLRFGSAGSFAVGTAERQTYMATNHNWVAGQPDPFAGADTRWEVYNAEIDALAGNRLMPATTSSGATRLETGRPMCSTAAPADAYRRVLIAAGINCYSEDVDGNSVGVAVTDFYEVFMTEPIGPSAGSQFDIWGEVIGKAGSVGAGGSGVFHEVVQLYR